jgi:hypothetical protein
MGLDVTQIIRELDAFGKTEVVCIESGDIVFHLVGNLDSISEIENLIQRVENIGVSGFKVTGEKNDGLFIIKIPYERFDNVPPYIQSK